MFINHFLIALRQMRRNKLYSVTNIFCLAAGIAVTMTILLYVLHEHSYDKWHAGSDRMFILHTPSSFGSQSFVNDRVTYITGPSARSSSAVEAMVRMMPGYLGIELQNPAMPQARFRENDHFLFADSNFFSFFSFRLRRGRPADVLARPFTVVLTETAAKKYFGTVDPLGKTLQLDSKYPVEVTGIVEDVPVNSSIRFEVVTSMATMGGMDNYKPYLEEGLQLQSGSFNTYVKLKRSSDSALVAGELTHLALVAAGKAPKPQGFASLNNESHRFVLFPIADIHLKSISGKINSRYLMPFSLAAGIVLLLALVNYMSLATARAAARAREVGVRKVLGAGRSKIAGQFYLESALFALASFLLGGVFFLWLRPCFFDLVGVQMAGGFLLSPVVLVFFGALLAVVILIAGSYPSLVLSGFRPVAVLYGKMSRERSGERIRKGFIVLQFTLSMALVICSAVVGKELYYIRHVDTGINRENIVMFDFDGTMEHYGAYQREVAALPSVEETATSCAELYTGVTWLNSLQVPGQVAPLNISGLCVDSPFIHMLGLTWAQPPRGAWSGRGRLLLNQAAVEAAKIDGDVIGRQVQVDKESVTVTGVLKDFNYLALRNPIGPLGIQVTDNPDNTWGPGLGGCLYVKLRAHANVPTVIEAIKNIYTKYDNRTPFTFRFLDEAFDNQYKAEDRLAGLMSVFTFITILIACLGLFALATFSAEQRVREIGIRKVLGASVASIGVLLSRDFLRPVLLAVVIACPLSWWTMHRWLEDFAYRTTLSWWVFALSGLGLLLVALSTVLVRSLRAGQANPVDNLRSE